MSNNAFLSASSRMDINGHSDYGAMKAVLNLRSLETMPTVKAWLRHAAVALTVVEENCNCATDQALRGAHRRERRRTARSPAYPSLGWRSDSPAANCSSTAGCTTSKQARKVSHAELGCFLPLDGDNMPMTTPC